jgi:hypothetical protein
MAYWFLQNDHGSYAIDWDIVYRIVRAYHTALAREQYATLVTTSESNWYNPFSWSLPDIRSVEVDWDRVRSSATKAADDDFNRLAEQAATRDVRDVYRELSYMVTATGSYTTAFVDWLGAVQTGNMSRINSAVDSYGTAIEVAKFVRDTSADGLMVGATILTGGAGVAVLGGGATMKGWAKFQDTADLSTDRRVGAAVATGVGNFMFGAFKLGGMKLTGGEEAVVTILQAQWETGVALTEGKSVAASLATGSLKLAGPFVDRFFKLAPVSSLLERACAPIVITAVTKSGVVENVASSVVSKTLTKVVQKQVVERFGKAGIKTMSEPRASGMYTLPAGGARQSVAIPAPGVGRQSVAIPAPGRQSVAIQAPVRVRQSAAIDNATLTNDLLLTLAIVDMAKGIGRGLY